MQNNIVVMADIAAIMSKKSGFSEEVCGAYVKELFLLIEDTLNEAGTLTIEGLGYFSNISGCVLFTPDESLAEELNSAFECFEPVELNDGVTDVDLDESDADYSSESSIAEKCALDSVHISGDDGLNANKSPILPPPIPEEDKKATNIKISSKLHSAIAKDADVTTENDNVVNVTSNLNFPTADAKEEYEVENGNSQKQRFSILSFVLGIIFGTVVCVGVNFLFLGNSCDDNVGKNEPVATQNADSSKASLVNNDVGKESAVGSASLNIDKKRQLPSKNRINSTPQYYKVTESSYLSNISRKYYGHYSFWIYIYIENKDKIKDPDNLPIGIVLTIPTKEKYGIDKDDKKSVERAELKAIELFGDK